MKKFLVIILPLVLLLSFSTQSISKNSNQFSFKNQATVLSENVFPEIQEMIDSFPSENNQEKFLQIIEKTEKILCKYSVDEKIFIMAPPDIAILKFQDKDNDYYILYIAMTLYDEEVSNPPLHTTIFIKKRFVVSHISKEQKVEI